MNGKGIRAEGLAAQGKIREARTTLPDVRREAPVAAGAMTDAFGLLTAGLDEAINNCGCNVRCGGRAGTEAAACGGPG